MGRAAELSQNTHKFTSAHWPSPFFILLRLMGFILAPIFIPHYTMKDLF